MIGGIHMNHNGDIIVDEMHWPIMPLVLAPIADRAPYRRNGGGSCLRGVLQ